MKILTENLRAFVGDILGAFGIIFLAIESYEVVTDCNVVMPFICFLILGFAAGTVFFLVDGIFGSGFLKREIEIFHKKSKTKIRVKFGDMFLEEGWKAIGVNDFFDSIVDEDLVSSRSLHGLVINRFWANDRTSWSEQVKRQLVKHNGTQEVRPKGNKTRYGIGTTVRGATDEHKFLFAAIGRTNLINNNASANAESLIMAARGMLNEARSACSLEPLIIPLMGDGLTRTGIKESMLLDLLINTTLEESEKGQITKEIIFVLTTDKSAMMNLKAHERKWKNG